MSKNINIKTDSISSAQHKTSKRMRCFPCRTKFTYVGSSNDIKCPKCGSDSVGLLFIMHI